MTVSAGGGTGVFPTAGNRKEDRQNSDIDI
jgi:hypothetical protein